MRRLLDTRPTVLNLRANRNLPRGFVGENCRLLPGPTTYNEGIDGGNVDDSSPLASLDHRPANQFSAQKCTSQIQVDQLAPGL